MKKLSIAQIKTAVKEVVIRKNIPVIIKGGFGIGKSQGVEQAVEELDSPEALKALLGEDCPYTGTTLTDIPLSSYDSVDLRGNPDINKKKGTTVWYPPDAMPFIGNDAFPDDKLHVVFFDEAPDAQAQVFAVMQRIVLTRALGEHVLMPNVRLIMAGNRDGDQSLARKFPMPLNNRLIHFEAVTALDEFCLYAQSQGVPQIFISFWNFRPMMLNTYDPKKTTPIVATPRTWFACVDIYQDKRLDACPEIKEASMIGAVGEGPAMDFLAYVDVWEKLPSIEKIARDPESYPVPEELGVKWATAMHVSEKMTLANADTLHVYLRRFPAEFVVMAWQLARARDATVADSDAFLDFVMQYRDVYSNN